MPAGQRANVMTLLGFNPASVGGLMGVEYLALPAGTPAGEALGEVGRSPTLQPEALTSIHALDDDGRLLGVATLVSLLQADPHTRLADVCDRDPARVSADTDVVDRPQDHRAGSRQRRGCPTAEQAAAGSRYNCGRR